jgi:drug/metabolite transporter (DMT)-like permease
MLTGALSWALYTNLARRLGGDGGVALYEIATGAVFLALRLALGEPSRWSLGLLLPAAFHVLAISALAYALWEHGVKRGDLVTLGSAAYGLPVAATAFTCAWLGERPGLWLLLGSALVAAGAVLCRLGIRPTPTPGSG